MDIFVSICVNSHLKIFQCVSKWDGLVGKDLNISWRVFLNAKFLKMYYYK